MKLKTIDRKKFRVSNKVKKEKYDKEFLKNKSTGIFDDFNNSEFDESSNIFDNDWNILVEVFPNAEEIRINLELLKPLSFVKDFANVNQKEDDVLLLGILGSFFGFILGLFVALIKEVRNKKLWS